MKAHTDSRTTGISKVNYSNRRKSAANRKMEPILGGRREKKVQALRGRSRNTAASDERL